MSPRDPLVRHRPTADTDAATDSDIAMIAAAMRRLMLPTDSMRTTISYGKNGIRITATVPPSHLPAPAADTAQLDQAAADFRLIDQRATTYGSRGNHRHRTMWALISHQRRSPS